jgi:hypothetical protein
MAIGAMVSKSTNLVLEIVEAASDTDMNYSSECAFIISETAKVGDTWDGTEFVSNAPAAVPHSITPLQARKALNAAGLRAAVEAAIAAGDQTTKDSWQYATEILRTDPLIVSLSGTLGLSSEQVDALFIQASTL